VIALGLFVFYNDGFDHPAKGRESSIFLPAGLLVTVKKWALFITNMNQSPQPMSFLRKANQ
jgi:hypothetical protein